MLLFLCLRGTALLGFTYTALVWDKTSSKEFRIVGEEINKASLSQSSSSFTCHSYTPFHTPFLPYFYVSLSLSLSLSDIYIYLSLCLSLFISLSSFSSNHNHVFCFQAFSHEPRHMSYLSPPPPPPPPLSLSLIVSFISA